MWQVNRVVNCVALYLMCVYHYQGRGFFWINRTDFDLLPKSTHHYLCFLKWPPKILKHNVRFTISSWVMQQDSECKHQRKDSRIHLSEWPSQSLVGILLRYKSWLIFLRVHKIFNICIVFVLSTVKYLWLE